MCAIEYESLGAEQQQQQQWETEKQQQQIAIITNESDNRNMLSIGFRPYI